MHLRKVMGAIYEAILHPEKFAALPPDQFSGKYSDAKGDGDKEEEAEFDENNNGIQETLYEGYHELSDVSTKAFPQTIRKDSEV